MLLKDYPDILDIKDIMQIFHIGLNSAYKLVKSGKIHAHRIGRSYKIPKCCVIDYIQSARYSNI